MNSHIIRFYAKQRLECRKARKRWHASGNEADFVIAQRKIDVDSRLYDSFAEARDFQENGHCYAPARYTEIKAYQVSRNAMDLD